MDTSVEDNEMTYDPEIEKLLPWYAKGLLEPEESKAVDAYLTEHPEMRKQLDLIAEETVAVDQLHAALGAPAPGGLDRLMASINEMEESPASRLSNAGGLIERSKAFFGSLSSSGLQWAAMAAAVVIVGQGMIIGGLMRAMPGEEANAPSYKTASGPDQDALVHGAKFLIAFKDDARMADIARLLKSQSAMIMAGPKTGGFMEIVVPTGKLPEAGIEAVLAAFKAETALVKFVSVSK